MKELILPLVALCIIFFVPLCVGSLLLPKTITRPFQWLVGLFAIGIFWLLSYVIAIPKSVISLSFLAVTLFCVGKWRVNIQKPKTSALIVYVCLLVILAFGVTDIYANPISDWDGFAIWLQKAKGFYFWNPLPTLTFVHYPGLGSMLWAVVLTFFGFHESFGRFIYPLVYVMFFAGIWSVLNTKKHEGVYALTIASLALMFFRPSLYNGYQDDFLAVTTGLTALLFCLSIFHPLRRSYYLLASFFGGSLGLIKNEGVLLGLILFVAFVLVNASEIARQWKDKSALYIKGFVMFVVLLGFWAVAITFYGIDPRDIQGDQINAGTILAGYKNVMRIPIIMPYLIRYTITHPLYTIILAASIIAAFRLSYMRKPIVFAWVVLGIHVVAVLWVYVSTGAPLVWHLDTSFERLMDHHIFLYVLLTICSLPLVLAGVRRHNPWV